MVEYRDRYFEDWTEGEIVESGPHLMTEERMRTFAEEFDPQPFHVDPAAAAETLYGGLIASGWHTGSVLMRLLATFLGPSSMGSPGVDNLRWHVPVRPDDVLRLRVHVLEKRVSSSRPDRGIIRWHHDLLNHHDQVVMSLDAVLFIQRRP